MIGFDGGAIGADIYCDRSGVHGKSLADCAQILDALKDPEEGYYDDRDPFTTVPRSSVITSTFASNLTKKTAKDTLKECRIGVVRESMAVSYTHLRAHET